MVPAERRVALDTTSLQAIDWESVQRSVEQGSFQSALSQLTRSYGVNLPAEQRLRLLEWLDALAGKVIYSTEHQLQARPYIVQGNDSLQALAAAWQVPASLIYKINQTKIGDPENLIPGTELKVVRGPFHAQVSIDQQELTLFVGGMYAGRFPITLGNGAAIEHGTFAVTRKQEGQDHTIVHPYEKYWIGLNGDLAIHDLGQAISGANQGSIRVGNRDAADLFGILTKHSQITIQR